MNVFEYSARADARFHAQAEEFGYKPISTFYSDLAIAEFFEIRGAERGAIRDTFNRVCEGWLGSYKMFTEFCLCLNWKIWEFYEKNDTIARLYNELWIEAEQKFFEKYAENEEATGYYYKITD